MSDDPVAVFLDRDGTIIEDAHFIKSPSQVRLIPGAADAIKRINDTGALVVVVTNQSGIARGLVTVDDYESVRLYYESLLEKHGAHIDRSYYCPHHPDVDGPCKCRKPGTLLFEQAIADLSLDPARIAYVGDRWRDVAVARKLGGRAFIVPSGMTTRDDHQRGKKDRAIFAPTLGQAVDALFGLTDSKRRK